MTERSVKKLDTFRPQNVKSRFFENQSHFFGFNFVKQSKIKHMRRNRFYSLLFAVMAVAYGQPSEAAVELTLSDVIAMAQENSPSAQAARHSYRSSYWSWRNYRASLLPSLTLSSSPYLNRTTDYVSLGDGTEKYVRHNNLKTDLTLDLSQNVLLTGGTLSVKSAARRLDLLGGGTTTYNFQPLTVTYSHSLLGYNSLRWDRRIEPLRFREARQQYAETMELVAAQASSCFFSLVQAQTNFDIAQQNRAAADTLYRFARGRYDIGTITENELLQLELNKLNEETNVLSAQMALSEAEDYLRSFLNLQDKEPIMVVTDSVVPLFTVPLAEAIELARHHSPDIIGLERQRLQSEENLAYAKANARLKANVYMSLGLAQTGDDLLRTAHDLVDEQYVSVGVSLPILDWGRGKGQVRMARSDLELTNIQTEQSLMTFEQNVTKLVSQFNLQGQRVSIARRTMDTAQRRYNVARHLYVSGRSTILDLNAAISEKDSAYRGYINSLATFWSLYYTLRSMTQYDFQWNLPIEYEYDI